MSGERMRELRKGVKLRQKEVAVVMGVRWETVCRWEGGKNPIGKLEEEAFLRLVNDVDVAERIRLGRRKVRREDRRGLRFGSFGAGQGTGGE